MPAFMSIGKLSEAEIVEPGEIKGDTTASWHEGWMMITSFSIDMKDERRGSLWEGLQQSTGARRKRRSQAEQEARDADADRPEKRENILRISKPTDSASTKILEWAKGSERHDVQIDCCTTEEEWPFLTLIFTGVTANKADFGDDLKDELEFSWKKAMVFSYAYDESNEPYACDFAEFGEDDTSSGTTTAAQRGVAEYVPEPPDPASGTAVGLAAAGLWQALSGGLPPVEEEGQVYDQERRRLVVDKVGDLEFELESMRGEERLSALFVYDLEVRSTTTKIEAKDLVGHEIGFSIQDEEGREDDTREPRWFHGIVTSVLAGDMASDHRRRYHLTVAPSVWRLTQRSDSRVWQDVTVKDVVEAVFKAAKFSDYDLQGVTRQHPKKPYVVQYQESDFAFVSRLLEDAGIWYTFKQEEGRHTMMLCDGPTGYVRCPEDPLLFARDVHREPRVTAWRSHHSFVPGKFDSRDFNFTTPREPVKGSSKSRIDLPGIEDAEIFEYPGLYEDADQATTIADRRLQERETLHHYVHGVGCYDSLAPGTTIAVEGRPGEEPDGPEASQRYLVTGLRHHAEQLPEYGLSIVGYRNSFVCIPEEVSYTPPRTTPRPRMLGPQTAIVVGDKEKDEDLVDTDEYGRIKVQFHWDRARPENQDSSCWIRVAQSGAGAGSGSMLIPRIGWEVVVSFLDGDPDRPLVTGVVYNELHKPYHELPAAKHKTVLMTRSFPNGGKENFNELTFHDEKDKEEVYFHAERDFKRVVEHDDVLEVGEKEEGGQTVTIQGDQSLTIAKGDRTKTIETGKETVTIKGDQATTLQSGDYTLDVSSGKATLTAAQSIQLEVGSSSIKLDTSSITLKVGGSTVKIDNTGVTIKGMNVKGEASLAAELKGMMTTVSGDGMLQTKGGITMMQ